MADIATVNSVAWADLSNVGGVAKASVGKLGGTLDAPSSYSNDYSVDFVAVSSQYVLLDDSGAGLNFDGTSPFSISFWIKPHTDTTDHAGALIHIFAKSLGSGGGYMGYHSYFYGGNFNWDVVNNSSASYMQYYAASPFVNWPTQEWKHIVCVYNGTSALTAFVNGVSMGGTQTAGSGGLPISTPIGTSAEFAAGVEPLHPATYFDGQIDEVSVWSAALNATQAAAIYNSGTPTDLTGTANLTNWWRMGDDAADDLTGTSGVINDQVASLDLTPINPTTGNKVADVP